MSANEEFPRGGQLVSAVAAGGIVTITIPAAPVDPATALTISHVIDQIKVRALTNAVAAPNIFNVSLTDGATVINPFMQMMADAPTVLDSDALSPMYVGAPGAAIVISTGGAAGVAFIVWVDFHEI